MFRRFQHQLLTRHLADKRVGFVLGAMVTAGLGWVILFTLLGDGLGRWSYDVPFVVQNGVPDDLVMVYFDAQVKARLGQPTDQALDRKFHAQLLDRLRHDNARLVLFDVLFDQPGPKPDSDEQLARAIHDHGRVVLAAESVKQIQGVVLSDVTLQPLPAFKAPFGLANVTHDPSDYSVRQIEAGTDTTPSVAWVAAGLLKASLTNGTADRFAQRWLNYYCPPSHLKTVNLDQAITPDLMPDGYFHDKIVVVGARPESLANQPMREDFGNPFSRIGGAFSPGAAVHGFSLVNLVHGEWLTRLSSAREKILVVLWGLTISAVLLRLSPWYAIGAAFIAAVAFALGAGYAQLRWHVWFNWAVPAFVQTGTALVWSVGYQYIVESRRRKRLHRVFAAYVSPQLADKVANTSFDLRPGGKEVEATIMFTDLENFTRLSEGLAPTEISRILNAYFEEAQRAIYDQDGTVLKFIGDAVLAAWGAPLPDPNPAERAVVAALNLRENSHITMGGQRLRTRIGINSGLVLHGNLGTDAKFDYTLIGDPINVAARLETLNKQLGTGILISETIRVGLSERILLRDLGKFLVAGKSNPVGIFEVLGQQTDPAQPAIAEPEWLRIFAQGRLKFVEGDWNSADQSFAEARRLRPGGDGPSQFFSEQIQLHFRNGAPREWDGVVRMEAK